MNKLMLVRSVTRSVTHSVVLGVMLVLTACPNIPEGTVINAVLATGITLNKTTLDITCNKPATLTANVIPSNATNTTVLWKSSNPSIAKVSESGLVSGVTVGGPITIEASIDGKKATCQVRVITPPSATKIELIFPTLNLAVNATRKLGYTLTPELSEDTVAWESSDTSKVTVADDGTLRAVAEGSATITAKVGGGGGTKTTTCVVTVKTPIPATSISIPASFTVRIGTPKDITATLVPANTTDEVIWSSSNSSIATVSDTGKVTALSEGSVTITAKVGDAGGSKTATCTVTAIFPPFELDGFDGIKNNGTLLAKTSEKKVMESLTEIVGSDGNKAPGTFYVWSFGVFVKDRTVKLSPFIIGKYEVTQQLYKAIVGSNPSMHTYAVETGETQELRPVDSVSWYDAVEFCNKLSEAVGLTPVYTITNRTPATGYPITNATVTADISKNGYRLPTAAEWEFAARGGVVSEGIPWRYDYAGSNTVYNVAWYKDNSSDKTHEVGKKIANSLGLYDMTGNVFEWCWDMDSVGTIPTGTVTNPQGAASGERIKYSSAYYEKSEDSYLAKRYSSVPTDRSSYLGFRVVRTAP